MRNSKSLTLKGFLTLLIFTGCASFEPGMRLQSLSGPRQPTAKASQEGLDVSVEEFINAEKSKMMFDTNLASSRILAIFVRADNNGAEKYSLQRTDFKAFLNGAPLAQLAAKDAASEAATSEYAGKALGWTLATGPFAILLWPVTIGASAIHTHGVNERIEAYFQGTSYQESLIAPKQAAWGFVYFKVGTKVETLENLIIEAEATGAETGKKLAYKFPLPVITISK